MTKTRLLLWATRLCGLACLAVFVMVKGANIDRLGIGSLWKAACPPEPLFRYGDLYAQTMVSRFKIPLPPLEGEAVTRTPSADAAKYGVFVLGDSFMQFRRGHEPFPQSLSERLGEPVDNEGWDIPSPTCLFRRLHVPVDKSRKRLVIVERVERLIPAQFSDVPDCPAWMVEEHRATRSASAFASRFADVVFRDDELAFRAFFSLFRLTRPAAEALFSLRFSLFGSISDQTPVYSLNPPFLFVVQETDPDLASSFYHPHDDALVERIADNVARMRDDLKAEANAELVFMPVPSKYTIAHTLLNDDPYDRFLPRLYDALEKRGVRTVRLYERFAAERPPPYCPTDTHWNPRGVDIALDETTKVLKSLGWR